MQIKCKLTLENGDESKGEFRFIGRLEIDENSFTIKQAITFGAYELSALFRQINYYMEVYVSPLEQERKKLEYAKDRSHRP